ncbi:hypothetical protein ABE10_02320, partial [Bacillus toyonensis]|nr:hypothetical protein [Bacillus toyonensis]
LTGTGHGRVGVDLEHPQLPVRRGLLACRRAGIRVDGEVAHQHVSAVRALRGRDEGREHRVPRRLLPRHLHAQVVRRLLLRAVLGVIRGLPPVVLLGEGTGVVDVVDAEHRPLHLEQVGGVPHVAHEVCRHVGDRLERGRVDLLPGLQHRVLIVPGVEGHLAVVGVDGGLDGVADVVDVLGGEARRVGVVVVDRPRKVHALGIRVGRAGRVSVDDPDDPPVHHARVRVLIEREVGRDLLHTGLGVAVVKDLRVLVHIVGEEDLLGLELQRVEHLREEVPDTRTSVATEGGLGLVRAVPTAWVVDLDVVRSLGRPDDRVLRRLLAEVDARFELLTVGEEARGRDAALEELGLSVGGALVARRGDEAVAVRVDDRVVVPALCVAELRRVELADRDHGVLRRAVDLVAVDVERVGELIIAAVLLELLHRRRHDVRVEDADRRRGVGVGAQLSGLGVGLRLERRGLELVDPERGLGRVDVALVVLRLQGVLVRLHLEGVHDPGIADADHERGDHEQRRRGEREAPASDERGDEEEDRDDGGQDRQDRQTGDGRVGAGVGGAGDPVVRCHECLVTVRPEADRLDQEIKTCQHGELDARRLRDAQLALPDAHRSVEVRHESGDEQAEDQHSRGEAEDRLIERHGEHVEAGVQTELRVDGVCRRAVDPQPHGLPLPRRGEAGEQSEEHRHAPHGQTPQRLDDLLIAVELRAQSCVHRAQPVGQLDGHEQRHGHAEEADEEHRRGRDPPCGQHLGEVQLLIPEEIRVERREGE